MDRVEKCLKKCRLYNFNSRKGIRILFNIPNFIELDNVKEEIKDYYKFFYIKKPVKTKVKKSKQEMINDFLDVNDDINIIETRPEDYSKDKYRMLINIKEEWLKKTLKKINKFFSQSLIEKNNKEIYYPIPYLHSSLKKRSYKTNVETHKNNKYILAIDLQAFYPSIKYEKVLSFFRYDLCLDKDIAEIYTALCTCPLDDPCTGDVDYGLGQGLATSPVLAYLSNYRMFEYINDFATKNSIEMTVYVDDIVFSSNVPFKQEFINSLFGIVKGNGLKIKKSKVKYFGPRKEKKITGLCITLDKKVKAPNAKHFETKIQYDYLSKKVLEIKNMEDYFSFYNLFLKFKGNVQFISLVENKTYKKFEIFIDEYKDYFLYGVRKIKKGAKYSKNNVKEMDYSKMISKYEALRSKIDSMKST